MTPEAKLRELAETATQGERSIVAMASDTEDGVPSAIVGVRRPYADGSVVALLCEVPSRSEDRQTITGIASAEQDAAYIAAVHPGVVIELLDALEKAEEAARLSRYQGENEAYKQVFNAARRVDNCDENAPSDRRAVMTFAERFKDRAILA